MLEGRNADNKYSLLMVIILSLVALVILVLVILKLSLVKTNSPSKCICSPNETTHTGDVIGDIVFDELIAKGIGSQCNGTVLCTLDGALFAWSSVRQRRCKIGEKYDPVERICIPR
ncbi:uncharacterized protein LOC136036622 isoform X1 [Artemia franciscana]|uniref:uncharacterized protein LOC136036622 isoform X1 n=1 Tax=Artemia franciscana TaxID=6661 RepID=UPI0032DA68C6